MSHFTARGVDRREMLLGAVGVILGASLMPGMAKATPKEAMAYLEKMTGKTPEASGKIELDLPEIAENGNTVPLGIQVDSPMDEGNYVKAVHVAAEGNPRPEVASFHFSPMSGRASASTRMRLAETQNVVAVAEMSDGRVLMAKREVKVTIGGCGG